VSELGTNPDYRNLVRGQVMPQPAYQGEFTEGEIVTYYNPEKMSWAERIYLPYVLAGLAMTAKITVRNLLTWIRWLFAWARGKGAAAPRGATTVYYPAEVRSDFSPINRGKHILTMRANGDSQCVACYMCATACPAFCIHIVAGEHPDPAIEKHPVRFDIEIDKCVFCGYCEEACPVDAIRLTPDVHLVDYRRERMVYDKDYLMTWNPTYVEDEHVYPGDKPRS
jgi:NADH-quinone oxidoreductase subunit I